MFDYQSTVLGSLLATPSLLAECDLVPSEFDESYQPIYQAILDVEASNDPIDILSVSERLQKDTGRNYAPRLGKLIQDNSYAREVKSFKSYCEQVRHANRIDSSREIAQKLLDEAGRTDTAIDDAIRDLMALNETRRNYDCSIAEAISEGLNEIDRAMNGEASTIPTGIRKLDTALGGLHGGDLIVVGARPSLGKTAFMINLALNAGTPVGMISTEQARDQIGLRSVAIDGMVSLHKMRTATLEQSDWAKMTASLAKLKDRAIRINDKPMATLNDILRQARKWKQLHDVSAIYVDYVQRIPGDNRIAKHERVELIVQGLKGLARELDIPVIALAQVNRKVEERADKRPFLADLKDSGSIEQEADQIMLLYRDDVYNHDSDRKGIMEIDVQKNRHGPTGVINATWLGEYVAIKDFAYERE